MAERGTIIAVRPGEVDVVMQPGTDCGNCTACSATSGGMVLEGVPVSGVFSVGDLVDVETPVATRSRARALVFITPVVALFLGYMLGYMLGAILPVSRDALGAVMALTCGAVAFAAVARFGARYAGEGRDDVRVRAIIAQAERPRDDIGARIVRPRNEEDQTRE